MNSFANVERALEAERARQIALVESGHRVEQVTLLFNAATGQVKPTRSKEESHDYRYFPDPDLPPLVLAPAWIAEQRAALPELPEAKRARLEAAHALSAKDARVITAEAGLAHYFESVVGAGADPKTAANWVMGEVMTTYNETGSFPVPARRLAELIGLGARRSGQPPGCQAGLRRAGPVARSRPTDSRDATGTGTGERSGRARWVGR